MRDARASTQNVSPGGSRGGADDVDVGAADAGGLDGRLWRVDGRLLTAGLAAASWAAYLFVLPHHRVWELPWFGAKLQPPEFVFLGLVAAAAVTWWRGGSSPRFVLADVAALSWVGANLLPFVWSGSGGRDAMVEALGACYLAVLYFAVRFTARADLLDRFGEWFAYSAAVAAALGIMASVAAMAGVPTRLATAAATPFPYLGHAARAQALTTGPQMLASILLIAVPLLAAARVGRWRRRDTIVLSAIIVGLMATFSKSVLALPAVLAVMWACGGFDPRDARRPRWRRGRLPLAAGVVATMTLTYALATHVMLVPLQTIPRMTAAHLVAGEPLATFHWRGDTWSVMPTVYVFNKMAALRAIGERWPWGVGPAGQLAFVEDLKPRGLYPASVWVAELTEPHATYLGPAAELGMAGSIAFVLILAAAAWSVRRLLRQSPRRADAAAFAAVGVAFLIEALGADLMNCRHYWFVFAALAASASAAPAAARQGP